MPTRLRSVLYVEDDPDVRKIGHLALEVVGGLEVRLCSSGAEALEVIEEFRPDLLLLDVMMPGMGGVATFHALRNRPDGAGPPVVFVTARVQPRETLLYREMGALGVIAKPFNPVTLAQDLRDLWARRDELAAAPQDAV